MGKIILLSLLLILVTAIVVTTSSVDPPPVTESAVQKIPAAISKDKDSSSSKESSESGSDQSKDSSSSKESSESDSGQSKDSSSSKESSEDDSDQSKDLSESVDVKKQMLCNVIVRATHDLHVYQSKSANEIITYLNTDCKNLATEELIEQCREMVAQYGTKIYEHVTNGVEMTQVCKKIEDLNEVDFDDERTAECSNKGGNKCQCCKMHVAKRKMRLLYIVKEMAKKRMYRCKKSPRPYRCRQWVQRKERRELKRIEKICPLAICKHLGYCEGSDVDNTASKVLFESKINNIAGSPSVWVELLDQQLEAHFTKDVCSEFTESQALCIHLAASIDGHRYAKLYMAMLHNDTTWIAKSIRKEVQSSQGGSKGDLCDACKNVVQSSKTIYLQLLETVRNAFISTHEQSPAKKKCGQFFTKRLDTINVYLQSLKPDSFCSTVHLCASSSLTVLSPVNDGGECVTCVQRLQPRKDAATQAVNRLSVYFTELCAKSSIPQCQQMVAEVATAARLFIDEFDVQETCLAMGFCGQNAAHDIDDYEHAFVEEIGNQVCSTMGPFATLCQLVVQGDSKQVQIVSLNATNIDDFFRDCEEKVDGENTVVVASDQCSQDKNKCQCCIDRVIQKKKCLKKRVAKYIWHMIYLCKRCPVREKCERYYKEKKARWDAKIDNICPKKVCIRMGYCTKADISSMCTYMGPFKQVCEQALNNIGQLFTEGHEQPSVVLTNQVSVQPKDEKEKQSVSNKP